MLTWFCSSVTAYKEKYDVNAKTDTFFVLIKSLFLPKDVLHMWYVKLNRVVLQTYLQMCSGHVLKKVALSIFLLIFL